MSLWDLSAAVDGYNRAHGDGKDKPEPMTIERLKAINPPKTIR